MSRTHRTFLAPKALTLLPHRTQPTSPRSPTRVNPLHCRCYCSSHRPDCHLAPTCLAAAWPLVRCRHTTRPAAPVCCARIAVCSTEHQREPALVLLLRLLWLYVGPTLPPLLRTLNSCSGLCNPHRLCHRVAASCQRGCVEFTIVAMWRYTMTHIEGH